MSSVGSQLPVLNDLNWISKIVSVQLFFFYNWTVGIWFSSKKGKAFLCVFFHIKIGVPPSLIHAIPCFYLLKKILGLKWNLALVASVPFILWAAVWVSFKQINKLSILLNYVYLNCINFKVFLYALYM